MILLTSPTPWNSGMLALPAGSFYVENGNAANALDLNAGICVHSAQNPRPWDAAQDWNGRSVLLVRSGGFGDLLFLTPLLRALRAKWPGVSLSVACSPCFNEALQDHPCLDQIIPYPLPVETLMRYDGVMWFEGLIEWDERARHTHSVELHADFAGVELTQGREMDYHAHAKHREAMRKRFPMAHVPVKNRVTGAVQNRRMPRIGIQWSASAACRTYPAEQRTALVKELSTFAQVVCFDTPKKHGVPEPQYEPMFYDLSTQQPPMSFAQSCAVLADCDVVIAPDSALVHVAGALHRPTIALYGPFPWELRTLHAPTVQGINGSACPMAPCFWHGRGAHFPPDGPCAKTGKCEALASIEPLRIVAMVKEVLAGKMAGQVSRI